MAACSNCGRELPPGGKFCPGCGTAQTQTASSSAPTIQASTGTTGPGPPGPSPHLSPADSEALVSRVIGWFRSLSRWDAAALGGGVLAAGLWYAWSKLDVKDT